VEDRKAAERERQQNGFEACARDFIEKYCKPWLHRRSSKKAMPWEKLETLLERMPLPSPKILHAV